MGLFTPKWKHKDSAKRLEWIKNADISSDKNQKIFVEIVNNDTELMVQKQALNRIVSIDELISIAKTHKLSEIRIKVVQKIKNEDVLYEIAQTDKEQIVRVAAVKKISKQKYLANIFNNDDYFDVKRIAIEKIEDQDILSEIALNCNDSFLRGTAVEKLENQNVLERIFLNDSEQQIKKEALGKIKNQDFLKEIIKNEKNLSIRKIAINNLNEPKVIADSLAIVSDKEVKRILLERLASMVMQITDNDLLVLIINRSNDFRATLKAIERIEEKEILIEIAKKNKVPEYRIKAIENILNEEVLNSIALNDSDSYVRKEVARKIVDEAVLIEMAKKEKSSNVIDTLVDGFKKIYIDIVDDNILVDKIYTNPLPEIRNYLVHKVKNIELLQKIIANDDSYIVRKAGYEKIGEIQNKTSVGFDNELLLEKNILRFASATKEQEILRDIVLNDNRETVRKESVKKIENQDVLKTIISNDKEDLEIRKIAIKSLIDIEILDVLACRKMSPEIKNHMGRSYDFLEIKREIEKRLCDLIEEENDCFVLKKILEDSYNISFKQKIISKLHTDLKDGDVEYFLNLLNRESNTELISSILHVLQRCYEDNKLSTQDKKAILALNGKVFREHTDVASTHTDETTGRNYNGVVGVSYDDFDLTEMKHEDTGSRHSDVPGIVFNLNK